MGDVLGFKRPGRSRSQMFEDMGVHPWERPNFQHCGATFHTDDRVYACELDPGHPGDHCGSPRSGSWFWRDGDAFIRPQR